jgi:light-regulated signal transduction histidine kinase (bacteriophytochrome)
MSEMVDGLLAFSRMGRQSMRPRRVLAEEAQEMVQKVIAEHSAEKNAPAPEIQVGNLHGCYADPILLQQVFTNLLTNAIKFSRKTTPAQVEVGSLETPQGSAYFVRDNGVGFDMQYAEKLFKVFQRLHSQEEFEGTGVGLAIIQRIVQRHRGEIWFHAEPGKGATFYFTIPLQEGDEI